MDEITTYNSLIIHILYFIVDRRLNYTAYHALEGQKSVWAVLCPIWPSSSD